MALVGPAARPLRRVLVALAAQDALAAGQMLAALLPAQGSVFDSADRVRPHDRGRRDVRGHGRRRGGGRSSASPSRAPGARPLFELRADPLALAELLAGDERRLGRFARPRPGDAAPAQGARAARPAGDPDEPRRGGRRRRPARARARLPRAPVRDRAPSGPAGHAFTIAQQITDPVPRTWYLDGPRRPPAWRSPRTERPADADRHDDARGVRPPAPRRPPRPASARSSGRPRRRRAPEVLDRPRPRRELRAARAQAPCVTASARDSPRRR